MNSIGNSVKFTKNGKIIVRIEEFFDFLMISIIDNGSGVKK